MPRLPYHKYLGPGNDLNSGVPVNQADVIAQEHDIAYSKAQSNSDIQKSDKQGALEFIGNFQDSGSIPSAIGALGLSAKYGTEKLFGVQYGMPKYQPLLGVRASQQGGAEYDSQSSTEDRDRSPIRNTPFEDLSPNSQYRHIEEGDTLAAEFTKNLNKKFIDQGKQREYENRNWNTPNQPGSSKDKQASPRVNIIDQQIINSNFKKGTKTKNSNTYEPEAKASKLSKFFQDYNPNNSETNRNIGIALPMMSQTDPMDTSGGMATSRAGSGPGMGSSGAAAANAPTIFTPKTVGGTPFERTYVKNSRWVLPASLTAYQSRITTVPTSTTVYDGNCQNTYSLGSSCHIPMTMTALYMDPYEQIEISRNYATFTIHDVSAVVTALGVRIPFVTGASTLQVANANIQCPVMQLDLDDRYIIEGSNPEEFASKIQGTPLHTSNGTYTDIARTTDFANISSRLETRIMRNRLNIIEQVPLKLVGAVVTGPQWTDGFPNILECVTKMINGSNHLGIAFEKTCPINKSFFKRTSQANDLPINQNVPNTEMYQLKDVVDIGASSKTVESIVQQYGTNVQTLYDDSLWGFMNRDDNSPKPNYNLSFAMYNIRNFTSDVVEDTSGVAYNSIVDLNFEFLLTSTMTCTGTLTVPLYYNLTIRPTPNWNHPHFLRSSTNGTNPVKYLHAQSTRGTHANIDNNKPQQVHI